MRDLHIEVVGLQFRLNGEPEEWKHREAVESNQEQARERERGA